MAEPAGAVRVRPALLVDAVSKSFGGVNALESVSCHIEAGSTLGIIGPNGAGKSTLINVVSGLYRPDRGRVLLGEDDVTTASLDRRARAGLVRTFQQTRLFHSMTVHEVLRVGAAAPRAGREKTSEVVDGLLDLFDLGAYAYRLVAVLPYGLQKVLNLALIAVSRPRVLLLDEPFAGVDAADIERLAGVIGRFKDEGVAVGLVEHNVRAVVDLSDRIIVLNSGALLFEGTPAETLGNDAVREAYLGRGATEAEHG